MNDKKDLHSRSGFGGKNDDDDDKKGVRSGGSVGSQRNFGDKDDDDDKKGVRSGGVAGSQHRFGGKDKDDDDKKGGPAVQPGGVVSKEDRGGGQKSAPVTGSQARVGAQSREERRNKLASAAAGAFVGGAALSPEEEGQIRSRINTLRSRYNSLFDRVNLNDIVSEINGMTSKIDRLPEQISEIRSAGYAFGSYLERKSDVLKERWDQIRNELNNTIQRESLPLRDDLQDYDEHILQAQQALDNRRQRASDQFLDELENGLSNIENNVDSIERRLRTSYETLEQDTYQAESQLGKIKWYLEQLGQACFQLYAGESVFMVAEAEWLDNKDNPNGYMYLTDQRMLFEQRETTGKFLGLFGGQKQHDVEWEFPLTAVEKVDAENKGFFGGKDMLNFTLGSGAPYAKITVEVKGDADCKVWAQQINRMKNGDARNERATQADAELIETLKNAPSNCHVCGATLPAVMQGQMQIECAYCGTVIRLV